MLHVWTYLILLTALLLSSRVARAQGQPLPAIVLTAAPDVPAGLVARVRGELTAAGLPLGAGVQTRSGQDARISIVIRQTEGELIAELEATNDAGRTQSRALSVPFVPGDSADVAEAGSELAVRTAEVLRTQLRSQALDLEAAPTAPSKSAVVVMAKANSVRVAPPPWFIAAGAGIVSGFIAGQSQIASVLNAGHVWRSGWFAGLGFLFPFSNAELTRKQGGVSVEPYVGTVDGGLTRTFSPRWRASCFASAGLAMTNIKGSGEAPFPSNAETAYALALSGGGNLAFTIAPNVAVMLQTRLTTLQPRPGIRVVAQNTATAAWIIPSATLGLSVSW